MKDIYICREWYLWCPVLLRIAAVCRKPRLATHGNLEVTPFLTDLVSMTFSLWDQDFTLMCVTFVLITVCHLWHKLRTDPNDSSRTLIATEKLPNCM